MTFGHKFWTVPAHMAFRNLAQMKGMGPAMVCLVGGKKLTDQQIRSRLQLRCTFVQNNWPHSPAESVSRDTLRLFSVDIAEPLKLIGSR